MTHDTDGCAGEPSVVFAVLSLVVRDPAFAQEDSFYRRRYRYQYGAPLTSSTESNRARMKALLPMLYLAKFDPNATVAEVRCCCVP